MYELTHASFFSGVGGLDLGLERAGWRTVSFSEIDPYASAVLAERWPGVPNLGDITTLRTRVEFGRELDGARDGSQLNQGEWGSEPRGGWATATLWSGGFPCQDLSVAGKRAGFAGARSSLAFAFLDLVERHRPPAILLENVPGLLSSNAGRDVGRLLREMGELGYWWAYRILDARHFGVPQRRRRVFIVGLHAGTGLGADSAAAVLSVGTRCPRHPAAGHATGEGAAERAVPGVDIARAVTGTSGKRHDDDTDTILAYAIKTTEGKQSGSPERSDRTLVLGPTPDPGGVRAADGLAGRLDDRPVTHSLTTRTAAEEDGTGRGVPLTPGGGVSDSELLPLGLDSHRYRCCGNGVVSSVSEWIGLRLAEVLQ